MKFLIVKISSTLLLSSHLPLGAPRGVFPVALPSYLLPFWLHVHLNVLDLITLIMLGKQHKQRSSSF